MKISPTKSALLLTAALCLFTQPALSLAQSHNQPLSNTFTTATESVIDIATSLDIKAPDAQFDPQMKDLQTAKANLVTMAGDGTREHGVLDTINDLIFQITACHVQARNGADTTQCQSQIGTARKTAMDSIGKHKDGSAWVDDSPA